MIKIANICGARPNFMKIAPIMDALRRADGVRALLVHTGQHYDERMSRLFFGQLGIPEPDVNLEVGSHSHAVQTGQVMERFEPVCLKEKPDWVLVVGDVNSTLACALVASKLGIRIAHVEAGLRSFDRTMPEEINRVLTDAISDALFVTEPSGVDNLKREGVADEKVHLVGNVMIDTLLRSRSRAEDSTILETLGVHPRRYAVLTLHRPSNVDSVEVFSSILGALEKMCEEMPVVFPMHPRSRKNLAAMGLEPRAQGIVQLRMVEPLGYLDFLKLTANAAVVLTDSGGIQEETTILGVPCLTLRDNTERPITVSQGTNRLIGSGKEAIVAAFREACERPPGPSRRPELWDGNAAQRIVDVLVRTS